MTKKPYGLLCPISRACELLEPRWTIQILTELWNGSSKFNEIKRGVGNISPSLLSKRLAELEAKGLVDRMEDKATGGVDYIRTQKAIELEPALHALAHWAQRHIEAEVALCDPDVSTLMWKVGKYVDREVLPQKRVVIRFHFDDEGLDYNTYWMVCQPGTLPEMCSYDPGFEIDLFVETNLTSFGAIMYARSTIEREVEEGGLFLSGNQKLARTMDRWLPKTYYTDVAGTALLRRAG
ncbi:MULTISPECIES: winged helix-turn-helix transcriptional regulator [Pseudosulfitobacter]|uniref:winged helix-turn-helix transcriptional regulator n=1 Tax=Pseudosulfitobacter pseudonitzschiae TaxID=1402135 RepID=UPI001581F3A4|nr:helix-turn-helix domain-containing protein [Pseudosulfitobacter pseudonitzschiae]QKS09508.1 helix-turn-helix transcriptional regulator [Pseudosulfitobacter pseudonitzschiae]